MYPQDNPHQLIYSDSQDQLLNGRALKLVNTPMDQAMGKYFVLTMIALKQQKGDDHTVVKDCAERLVTALKTEILGFTFPAQLYSPAFKSLQPVGAHLM